VQHALWREDRSKQAKMERVEKARWQQGGGVVECDCSILSAALLCFLPSTIHIKRPVPSKQKSDLGRSSRVFSLFSFFLFQSIITKHHKEQEDWEAGPLTSHHYSIRLSLIRHSTTPAGRLPPSTALSTEDTTSHHTKLQPWHTSTTQMPT